MHKYIHFIFAKLVYKAKMNDRQRINIGPNQCHKTKPTTAYSNRTKSKLASDTMFQPTSLYPFNCTFLFWFTMDWVRGYGSEYLLHVDGVCIVVTL